MRSRRRVLGSLGTSVLVGTAGCVGPLRDAWGVGSGEQELEVTGDEPSIAPGTEPTLRVEAAPVQSLQIVPQRPTGLRSDGTSEPVELDVTETTLEPNPSGGLDSMPPVWQWGPPAHVSAEIPVFVSDDADAGEYPYVVDVTGGDVRSEEESETVEFVLIVTSD